MKRKNRKLLNAVSEALNRQGGKHAIGPLGSRHEGGAVGKGKTAAGRAETAKEGLGLAFCKASEQEQLTARKMLVGILSENVATILLAKQEIEGYRDDKVAELGHSQTDRRAARSLQANWQRPISILKHCAKVKESGGDIKAIVAEQSIHRMYALCTRKKTGRKAEPRPMADEQFVKYRDQVARIVPPLPKNATETEIAKHQAGLLRLETMFRRVTAEMARYEHEISIPVGKVLALSKAIKSGKERVKLAA